MKTFRTTFLFLLLCALLLASLVHAQEETDGQQDTDLFEKDALDIDDAGMDMETEEEDAVAAAANKVCSALMQGADRQLVAILATNVSTAEGKYDMRLPTNIAPSNDSIGRRNYAYNKR
ncbi:hypothetical protein BCR43DRAFT_506851 [Syncephalastrum racemosum]|uniref:Uncharacterized protein n=1 Tax=Syncephalastrum racemosum TaxID=13706 RepID=A0A1X2H8N7_SYNRA|nr:hypothetical protein BCR43DRAFT_506851 [Syncephalastrum racemosum]